MFRSTLQWQVNAMIEYGDIFDYQLSMMGFEYLSLAIFAAYGLIVVWIFRHPNRSIDTKRHPQQVSDEHE
jgi:hypothetical protein